MSRYELRINGSPYTVEIVNISGTRATVEVNGLTYEVEIPPSAAVAKTSPPAPLAVPVSAAPTATALARARPVPQPPPPAPRPAPVPPAPAAPSAAPGGGEVITAPMPGHILAVPAGVGEKVEAGDTVVVMEAMKMENEIKAHVTGTIREVKVAKGQDVSVGEVLVVIGAG